MDSPLLWSRTARTETHLPRQHGLYALFLKPGATLPGIDQPANRLLYIGKAGGADGLLGRCHFNGKTRNHSPRKSLAALLRNTLQLIPTLIEKQNSSDTWGLEPDSDRILTEWMHASLEIAFVVLPNPRPAEKKLILEYAPPLNLDDCIQTLQHRKISSMRKEIRQHLQTEHKCASNEVQVRIHRPRSPSVVSTAQASRRYAGAQYDSAPAIAHRYNLNEKSYRRKLRLEYPNHPKGSSWDAEVGSLQHQKMILVAEEMQRGRRMTSYRSLQK